MKDSWDSQRIRCIKYLYKNYHPVWLGMSPAVFKSSWSVYQANKFIPLHYYAGLNPNEMYEMIVVD